MEHLTILHLSDLHSRGKVNLQGIARVIAENNVKLVVLSGDLTQFGNEVAVEKTLKAFDKLGILVFYVTGNLDAPGAYHFAFPNVKPLEGRREQFQGIQFVGLSGSNITPLNTMYELTEEEIRIKLDHLKNQLDSTIPFILVSHVPPFNSGADTLHNGKAVGSPTLRDFILNEHPLAVCTGHIHEAKIVTRLNSTFVINPGPARHQNAAILQLSYTDSSAVDIEVALISF